MNINAVSENRSFDKNNINNSTLGENHNFKNLCPYLQPIYPEKYLRLIQLYLNRSLKIMAKTWHRDSHGLFDFESTTLKKFTLSNKGSGKCLKFKQTIGMIFRDSLD